MVKKCLIAIAVVTLLATTVQAITVGSTIKEDGTWPWTKIFDKMPICTFPVKLEVGHFVQIEKCGDLVMKLEQVNCGDPEIDKSGKFPCYGKVGGGANDNDGPACVTVKARANFAATFGATFTGSGVDIIGGHSLSWPIGDTIAGSGSYESLKLCMKAWSVELWNAGTTSGWVTVGTITITVKPQNESGP